MLSRVADNLYWLSRYLERSEHTARLLDVNLDEVLDRNSAVADQQLDLLVDSLRLQKSREALLGTAVHEARHPIRALPELLMLDAAQPHSIAYSIATARENARQVREQISSEMWLQINWLYQNIRTTTAERIWENSPHDFLQTLVKDGIHLFRGLTDATMNHGEGWQFIQLGCYMERAQATAKVLDAHFRVNHTIERNGPYEQDLAWISLLKSCTAFEAYCKVYTVQIEPERVAEFLLLNADSPRSVRFAADRILEAVRAIATATGKQRGDPVTRLAGKLSASLDYSSVDEILDEGLHAYCVNIQNQCAKIHQAIYDRYIQPKSVLS
ncbi:MAG: alpha-E domain-containing protein [Chloroflexi bacterium]|nr:alpha-E domain-containing protein [Chloroflexota bacterium]